MLVLSSLIDKLFVTEDYDSSKVELTTQIAFIKRCCLLNTMFAKNLCTEQYIKILLTVIGMYCDTGMVAAALFFEEGEGGGSGKRFLLR